MIMLCGGHIYVTFSTYKNILHIDVNQAVAVFVRLQAAQDSGLIPTCLIRETSGTDHIEPSMPNYAHTVLWSARSTF